MPTKACIQIQDLYKKYNKAENYSLEGINLRINSGSKFGILGPNGAGKTTLISIICNIIPPSSGSVSFEKGNNIKQHLGFVPQDYAFYPQLSPVQNMEYFGALYNLSKENIAFRIQQLLGTLGLESVADKKVNTFSGGMKRRVNLGIGMLHNPSILLLDEPTVGVDVQSRHAIMQLLNEINAQGTTIIYTSHHLKEAEDFCDHIALIDHGKIIANDSTSSLLKTHQSDDLESLFIDLTGTEYRDV